LFEYWIGSAKSALLAEIAAAGGTPPLVQAAA
jgi:hypothetical protein